MLQDIRHCIDPDLWGVIADDDEFTTELIDQIGLPRMIEGSRPRPGERDAGVVCLFGPYIVKPT